MPDRHSLFIHQANIDDFIARIAVEPDEMKLRALRILLIEEKRKLSDAIMANHLRNRLDGQH